jgi:hypothetical protein
MKEILDLYKKHPDINDENFNEIKSVITTFLQANKGYGLDSGDSFIRYWFEKIISKSAEHQDVDFMSQLTHFKDVSLNSFIYDALQKPTVENVNILLQIKEKKLLGWNFKGYEYFNDCVDLKKMPPNTTLNVIEFCGITENEFTSKFFDYSMKSFDNDDLEKMLLNIYFKNSYYSDKNQAPASKNRFIIGRFSRGINQFELLLNHLDFTQYNKEDYCKLYNVKTMPFNVLTQEDVAEILQDKQLNPDPEALNPRAYIELKPKLELFLEKQKVILEKEKLTLGQTFDGDEKFQKLININNENVEKFLDIIRIHCNIKCPNLIDETNAYFSLVDQANSICEIKYTHVNWNETQLEQLIYLNSKILPKMLNRLEDSFTLAEIKESKNEYLLSNQQEFLNDIVLATRKIHAFINQIEAVEQINIEHKEIKKRKI